MRRYFVFVLLMICVASVRAADKAYSNVVQCDSSKGTVPNGECDTDLSVSGATLSSILISNLSGSGDVSVVLFPGEAKRQDLGNCPAPGRAFKFVVEKRRSFFPGWATRIGHTFRTPQAPDKPSCENPRIILDATTPDITFAIGDKSYRVLIRHQRWWMETGGFYAFSWARDTNLVTVTEDVGGTSKIRVLRLEEGDRIGPTTGVTFVFHPGDYPEYGWEFGTSTSGDRTHYYLGGTVRLIQFNDRALLTVGAGLSHVRVTHFPDITLTNPDGTTRYYNSDDPLLAGRTHYVNKPYISLGLGITIGGPAAAAK